MTARLSLRSRPEIAPKQAADVVEGCVDQNKPGGTPSDRDQRMERLPLACFASVKSASRLVQACPLIASRLIIAAIDRFESLPPACFIALLLA
ncbi:unnamed protein product [Linum trigynum]|uniref:Uncharacterized protein n=1 Tax=Linum trigynum TaxID=586398 RepID=A0AAV2G8E3_9ROSI